MEKKLAAYLDMWRKLKTFGLDYMSRFAKGSPAATTFAKLSTLVDALNQDAAAHISNLREGRDQQVAARDGLVLCLDAIARMAQVIDRTIPGFAERFVIARPKNTPRVLATAYAFLKDAEPVAAQFIAHGLPDTFLADLKAALDTFERAIESRHTGKMARAAANAATRQTRQQMRTLVGQLDVIIRYQFADDQAMQGAWTRARQLDGLPQPTAAKGVLPSTPAAPRAPTGVSAPASPPASPPTGDPAAATPR